jgi:hypothetical protein
MPNDALMPSALEPALDAAAKTGFLVYPPLHPHESVEVRLLDTGSFAFTLRVKGPRGTDAPVFTVRIGGSAGWGGLGNHEVLFIDEKADVDAELIGQLMGAMTTNVMPGTVGQFGLLGAYNFITPEGWNSVCMGTINRPRADGIPVLNCLVESDWYPQNTEFRYGFKRGEFIQVTHDTPLGQVLFVPREAVQLVEVADEQAAAAG